jgi:hypothetical protein
MTSVANALKSVQDIGKSSTLGRVGVAGRRLADCRFKGGGELEDGESESVSNSECLRFLLGEASNSSELAR